MNTTQPIRKPFKKWETQLNKHRRLARTVNGRLFQAKGKLYLVSDTPPLDQLLPSLLVLWRGDSDDSETSHTPIVFNGVRENELTLSMLNKISYSLKRWQFSLSDNLKKSREKEHREIDRLHQRLKFCFQCLDRCDETTRLLLTSEQKKDFQRTCRQSVRQLSFSEQKLTRAVYWFSGQRAASRFVDVLASCFGNHENKLARIVKSRDWLQTLLRRIDSDPQLAIKYEFRHNETFRNLIQWVKQKQLPWKPCQGPLKDRLTAHIENLTSVHDSMARYVTLDFPIILAAWAICDRGTSRLPITAINKKRDQLAAEPLKKLAQSFITVSDHPKYDRLLDLINVADRKTTISDRRVILNLFSRGASTEDVIQILDAFKPGWIDNEVEISKLRQFIGRVRRVLGMPNERLDGALRQFVRSQSSISIGLTIFNWLDLFPDECFTPRVRTIVLNLLAEIAPTLDSKQIENSLRAELTSWSNRQPADRTTIENEAKWPTVAKRWLRRLSFYRQLSGQPKRVPKSLEKPFEFIRKRSKEIEYLNSHVESGQITQKQKSRLDYLCNHGPGSEIVAVSIRKVQQACLFAGLSALKQSVANAASQVWSEQASFGMGDWSMSRSISMATWACQMSSNQGKLLRQTLRAWKSKGPHYKFFLPFNANWIKQARRYQVDVGRWLNSTSRSTTLDGDQITLQVVTNPLEIYFMGTYFNICLSQGGCNEMSVLANAAHANKQVVYARTSTGTVIGRQLIAINKDFKLVGYHNYVNTAGVSDINRDRLIGEFAGFAADIARQVKIELEFEENAKDPESLGSHFWYDDGIHAWHSSVRHSCERKSTNPSTPLADYLPTSSPQSHTVMRPSLHDRVFALRNRPTVLDT